jgi:hypothetical protein
MLSSGSLGCFADGCSDDFMLCAAADFSVANTAYLATLQSMVPAASATAPTPTFVTTAG